MLIPLAAGLALSGPLVPTSNFLPASYLSAFCTAGLLLTSRSLELVLGSKRLGLLLAGSLVSSELAALALQIGGRNSFNATTLSAVVALEVLYYGICPYRKLLQLAPHIRVGAGTLVLLAILCLTETANDAFNLLGGVVYALASLAFVKRKGQQT